MIAFSGNALDHIRIFLCEQIDTHLQPLLFRIERSIFGAERADIAAKRYMPPDSFIGKEKRSGEDKDRRRNKQELRRLQNFTDALFQRKFWHKANNILLAKIRNF